MERAWEYFKTEKDVFLVVAKYATDEERNLLKKKFGKDYDGINVKTSIKKNEFNSFNLTCKKIMIDIAFAEKVKQNSKIMENYLRDANYDIIKKIMYTYNISRETVNEALDTLTYAERTAFLYYFGIDRKKISLSSIAELLKTNELYVVTYISSAIESIKRNILKTAKVKVTVNTTKQELQIPISLVNPLIKKGYSLKEIHTAIRQYDDEAISVLKRLYGSDFTNARSIMIKVSQKDANAVLKVLNGDDNIESKIINARKEKKQAMNKDKKPIYFEGNLVQHYLKQGYSKSEFINAYRELTAEEKRILLLGFDRSFNSVDIFQLEKSERDLVYAIAFSSEKGIKYYLNKNAKKLYISDSLYSILEKKGIDKKYTDAAILNLNNTQKNRLNEYFDDNLIETKKIEKGTIVYDLIHFVIPDIVQTLKSLNVELEIFSSSVYNGFKNISPIDVNLASYELTESEYKIYSETFDENGKMKKEIFTNLNIKNILLYALPKNIEKILKMKSDSKNLYSYFEFTLFDIKQIHQILDSNELNTFYKYYDENLNRREDVIFDKEIYNILNKIEKGLINFNLYELYKLFGFSKEDVDYALNTINKTQKNKIMQRYDKNLNRIGSFENTSFIYSIIKEVIPGIILNHKDKKDTEEKSGSKKFIPVNLYKRYIKKGYTHELVDIAISNLSPANQTVIKNIYDETGNQLASISSEKNANNILNAIMNRNLQRISELVDVTTDLVLYSKTLGIKKEELIKNIEELGEEDKNVFYSYYDENLIRKKDIPFDINIYRILTTLFSQSFTIDHRKKSINLYKKYINAGYTREMVDIAISLLSAENKEKIKRVFNEVGNQRNLVTSEKSLNTVLNSVIPDYLKKISKFMNDTLDLRKRYAELTEDELINYIEKLNEQDKTLFYTYYDKSLKKQKDGVFDLHIYTIVKTLDDEMKVVSSVVSETFNLYSYFEKFGFDKLEVKNAISCLSSYENNTFYSYYDTNLERKKDTIFNNELHLILKKLENKISKINLYEKYEFLGYTKEKVDLAMTNMRSIQRDLLKRYIDEDLNVHTDILNNKAVLNIINNVLPNLMKKETLIKKEKPMVQDPSIYEKMEELGFKRKTAEIILNLIPGFKKKILSNYFDKNGDAIKSYINSKLVTDIFERIIPRKSQQVSMFCISTKNLYDYFKRGNYYKARVDKIISELEEEKRNILYTYYDKNLERIEEIDLDVTIFNFINSLESKLKYTNLYEMYNDMGYSKEEIDDLLNNKLQGKTRKILYDYFDTELNQKRKYQKSDYIYIIINQLIPKKLVELDKKNNTLVNDIDLYSEYLSVIKKLNIFSKEFISSLNISDEEKYYLTIEFVFNVQSTFKSEELAKFLNLEYKDYVNKVYQAMMKTRNELNTKFYDSLENIKKVLD